MLMIPEGMLKRKVYSDGLSLSFPDGIEHPVFMPQSAKDFQLLGIGVPEHLWLCQQAAGNLADSIGALTLVANGAVSYQYAGLAPNWMKKAVGFTEVANQRFQAAAGAGPDPSAESIAWLVYFFTANVAAPRGLAIGAADPVNDGVGLYLVPGTFLRVNCVGSDVDGTGIYDDGLVHPALLVYDRTAGTVRGYTDYEQVDGAYDAGVIDATKGFGGIGGEIPFPGNIFWGCAVGGAVAETYGKATLQQLGWSLTY